MASSRRPNSRIVAGIVLLLGIATTAGRVYPEPRLLTLCALAALVIGTLVWHTLSTLVPRHSGAPAEVPIGILRDQDLLVETLLAFETRLEHAPIALFRINQSDGSDKVIPLNAMARRALAPGRATDPADLYRQLDSSPSGQRSMIDFETERGIERALVSVSEINLKGVAQRLVALIPMESQLEAEALHAWQELAHVLTHEIMNSLTPVASLSYTARELLEELRPSLPADASADLTTALDTIGRRAGSLANFVSSYRSLSNVPVARPERISLNDLFARLSALLSPGWAGRGGRIEFVVEPSSLEMLIDPGQFEQALINLLQNAAEATAAMAEPGAVVSAKLGRGGRLRIEVADNGGGVPDTLIQHIFTPFFSTKEKGSGVGLAMVRQLVFGNGGTVRYAKSISGGARFILTF